MKVKPIQELLSMYVQAVKANEIGIEASVQCELAERYLNIAGEPEKSTSPTTEQDKILADLDTLPSARAKVLFLALLAQERNRKEIERITSPFLSEDIFKEGDTGHSAFQVVRFKLEVEHGDELDQLRDKVLPISRIIDERVAGLDPKTLKPID